MILITGDNVFTITVFIKYPVMYPDMYQGYATREYELKTIIGSGGGIASCHNISWTLSLLTTNGIEF
jgi:hypothetical protein